ncbi:MAG: glycosyltransferase family 39 protein [Candidatus Heimdallarchaeota archaeon]|nr:glycosyltransferase family 39 protein [Candidatus Heimdallarchaeota archaeon]
MSSVENEWIDRVANRVKDHFEDFEISRTQVFHSISLTLILVTAFFVRLVSTLRGWDPIIKAFDPHMQVRAGEYILEYGFFKFLLWHDSLSWYPYGRAMGSSMYVAVPIAMVTIYKILTFIGFTITLEYAAYLVPVVFGTLGVFFTYLFGKELVSPRTGLLASLIMVVTPAYVSRSIAGFVDNESVGVLLTVMSFYFFVRAYSRDSNRSAVFAGISLAMLGGSWGAFRFAYDLMPVFALVMVITGNYTTRLLKSYVITIGVSTLIMITIPRIGGGFLLETEGIAPIAFVAFLVLFGIIQNLSQSLSPAAFRRFIVYAFVALAAVTGLIFLALLLTGVVEGIGSKFISVLLPDSRNDLPLIDSVSEHLPLAWGNLYSNLSTLVFFIPLGIYFAIKKPSEKNLFILVFGLFTIYFSGSMVRLMLLLAPAAAILTAFAIDQMLKPYALAGHGRIKLTKRTMTSRSIGSGDAARSYAVVFFLMIIMLSSGVTSAVDRYSSPELTPSIDETRSPNGALTDWLDAFDWMQQHTSYYNYTAQKNYDGYLKNYSPPIMLSWWDYGYYITAKGDTMTLVDNATTNSTQIGVVGSMLMYNESTSLALMYQYDVQYVLVVPAGGQTGLGSDLGKAVWMIRISEKYTPQFGIVEDEYYSETEGYVNKFYDSVLFRLMSYRAPDMDANAQARPPYVTDNANLAPELRDHDITELDYFTEVWRSIGLNNEQLIYNYPIVRIFKVNYPDDIDLRVQEFNHNIQLAKMRLDAAAAAEE